MGLSLLSETGISLTTGIALIGGLLVAYFVGNAIYSVTLHPLAAYPGPFWPSVSRIPWWVVMITGEQAAWMQKLHTEYGAVVRFGPNDLSYLDQDGDIWKEIHGEKGRVEYSRPQEWIFKPFNGE